MSDNNTELKCSQSGKGIRVSQINLKNINKLKSFSQNLY